MYSIILGYEEEREVSTKNLLQQQLEIIQRSQSITNDYEGGRSIAESRLKREKETAEATRNHSKGATEATWKNDKETAEVIRNRSKEAAEAAWRNDKSTIELNWNRTKAPVERAILSVRESINSAHNVLQRTSWQDTLPQAASRKELPHTSAFQSGSSFDKLMTTYQLASEQTSTQ